MQVGVPREVKNREYRVALTPAGVTELVRAGHEVLVEHGAGEGSSIPDSDFVAAGARIAPTADDVWAAADLLLKVKEPVAEEYGRLRADQTLFTYLHLAASKECTDALVASGTTAIAYETVQEHGRLPLLAPMSEIAGQLAVQAGVTYLQRPHGGRGLLAGAVAGIPPARIVIVGGGVVGYNAALIALGLGAHVQILDISVDRLRALETIFRDRRIELLVSSPSRLAACVAQADLVVGAVLVTGASAPQVITEEMVAGMRDGSVLVDVAIDQGGCAATSRATSYDDPVFTVHGVTHYCVANLPGAVPVSSTLAIGNATASYARAIAARGWRDALRADPVLATGLNVARGLVTHPAVASALEIPYHPATDVLDPAPAGA
jgi:alanine dehydrogenase